MIIKARFPGVCPVCRRPIEIGDSVEWKPQQKGVAHAICTEEGKKIKAQVAESRATISAIEPPCPEGLSFLGYQKAGVAYAANRSGTLIADEMGLGKTIQAIGAVNVWTEVSSVLVICPASLKLNWRAEFQKWSTRGGVIRIHGQPWEEIHTLRPSDDLYVTVINYDQLKKIGFEESWDLVILDEAHYIKNREAKRTVLAQTIARRCKRKVLLTGTPVLNRPVELFSLLQVADPETWDPPGFVRGKQVPAGHGAGFWKFAKRYCDAREVYYGRKKVWEFDGAKNLDELQEKLRASCMVRRLKADVLKDLPPKRRQVVLLDAPESKGEKSAFEELNLSYEEAVDELVGKRIAFDKLSKARHETALAKVPAAIEHIKNVLESTEKLIVFAHHLDVVDELYYSLQDYGAVTITGATVTEYRHEAVQRFQNDAACRVIIGTIGAMGTGLTLTAAAHVIFVEFSWVPAELSQAEDRAHRIGQTESVLVQHLVAQRSIDAKMINMVIAKQEIADMALDDIQVDDIEKREVVTITTPTVEEERKRAALAKLRFLAMRCDGAVVRDGQGFNGADSYIGKRLASQDVLSAKQTLYAERMLAKYKRQLEEMN